MRIFAQFTLLAILLVLVTSAFPPDVRAGELAEDGLSNAFHQAFDNENDPAKRLKALRDEQGRQQAWLDAAVKKANQNMQDTIKKQFAISQSKWEKWYGLERKFLEAVSPNGTLNDEMEHYLLGILVLRTNFMRVQPMNIESETNDRYVPKPIVFAKVRDGMPRDPDGMTTEREERKTEDGLALAPIQVIFAEHEIQDKWLNADFKALRDCLDDTQKTALRDTQRAWLQWHLDDYRYIYDVLGDGGVREWLQYRKLWMFTLRVVQMEYLLAKVGSKGILEDSKPVKAGVSVIPTANAICRVVVTGADASVMDTPSPKGNVRFKASAPAEYIATRYTTVCAGSECDGSVWYELPGAFDYDGEKVAPSLAGRTAKGALLHAPLYINAKSVREIPLREGDAEAVGEMLARKSENDYEPQETAIDKITTALVRHAGKSVLEAKALRGDAAVIGLWDSDDDEEFAHVQEVYTDTFLARYFAGTPTSVYLAENGANIGGIVLGTTTMADVRKILGEMGDEHAVDEDEKDGFTFKKYNLSGGAPIYDSEAPVDRRIPFKAVKKLAIEWIRGEGMGESVTVFFDEGGHAVAIERQAIGWR